MGKMGPKNGRFENICLMDRAARLEMLGLGLHLKAEKPVHVIKPAGFRFFPMCNGNAWHWCASQNGFTELTSSRMLQ